MQDKRHQKPPRFVSLKITARSSEKLCKKPVLQLEIRCSIRLSYRRRLRGQYVACELEKSSANAATSTSASVTQKLSRCRGAGIFIRSKNILQTKVLHAKKLALISIYEKTSPPRFVFPSPDCCFRLASAALYAWADQRRSSQWTTGEQIWRAGDRC
jgi:hypothetical protein